MTDEQQVTPAEVGRMVAERGLEISQATITYHCRDRRGALYGKARKVGRSWSIPLADAQAFAEQWEPYGSMRK